MKTQMIFVVLMTVFTSVFLLPTTEFDGKSGRSLVQNQDGQAAAINDNSPSTVVEARFRARMLHETVSGILQVVHRDLFREDQSLSIPSKSFEDVFDELAINQNIKLRWLAINTKAMSKNHVAISQFEKNAVKAISAGKTEFESFEKGVYQFVGSVRLSAHCLKCHVTSRKSNADRAAGLYIAMPIKSVRSKE